MLRSFPREDHGGVREKYGQSIYKVVSMAHNIVDKIEMAISETKQWAVQEVQPTPHHARLRF